MFAMDRINRFMHSNTANYFRLFIILISFSGVFLNSFASFASAQENCPSGVASCQGPPGTLFCTNAGETSCVAFTGSCTPPHSHECVVPAAQPANTVICSIVGVYSTIISAIFIIGLMLMILGGSLYAGAHLMPGATKGTLQGYGMGMVLGGVIGIIIAVIAPFIFGVLTGNTVGAVFSSANAFCAPP